MTYFGFLIRFIGIPLAVLAALTWRDRRQGRALRPGLDNQPGWLALAAHVLAAVAWTTPWDNYLVATGVWYYSPALVAGPTLGWVPIEEYTFFVVQTLLTGSWLLWLARRVPMAPNRVPSPSWSRLRWIAASVAGIIWAAAVSLLLSGWRPGAYLGLELGWMLPPIILQLIVGADALWRQRRLVATALLPPVLYLCVADALAIGSGTWTIAPSHSTGVMVAGVLPVEELVFFWLTNTLVVFGMILLLAANPQEVHRQIATLRPSRNKAAKRLS